ncbi:hypothetical protein HN51_027371 [Arachis hypogaea]
MPPRLYAPVLPSRCSTAPAPVVALYNDIAKFGYVALGRSKFTGEKDSSQSNSPTLQNASHVKRPAGLGG